MKLLNIKILQTKWREKKKTLLNMCHNAKYLFPQNKVQYTYRNICFLSIVFTFIHKYLEQTLPSIYRAIEIDFSVSVKVLYYLSTIYKLAFSASNFFFALFYDYTFRKLLPQNGSKDVEMEIEEEDRDDSDVEVNEDEEELERGGECEEKKNILSRKGNEHYERTNGSFRKEGEMINDEMNEELATREYLHILNTLSVSAIVYVVVMVGMIMCSNYIQLFFFLFVMGVNNSNIFILIQKIYTRNMYSEHRSTIFGILHFFSAISHMISISVNTNISNKIFFDIRGWRICYCIILLLPIPVIFFLFLLIKQERTNEKGIISGRRARDAFEEMENPSDGERFSIVHNSSDILNKHKMKKENRMIKEVSLDNIPLLCERETDGNSTEEEKRFFDNKQFHPDLEKLRGLSTNGKKIPYKEGMEETAKYKEFLNRERDETSSMEEDTHKGTEVIIDMYEGTCIKSNKMNSKGEDKKYFEQNKMKELTEEINVDIRNDEHNNGNNKLHVHNRNGNEFFETKEVDSYIRNDERDHSQNYGVYINDGRKMESNRDSFQRNLHDYCHRNERSENTNCYSGSESFTTEKIEECYKSTIIPGYETQKELMKIAEENETLLIKSENRIKKEQVYIGENDNYKDVSRDKYRYIDKEKYGEKGRYINHGVESKRKKRKNGDTTSKTKFEFSYIYKIHYVCKNYSFWIMLTMGMLNGIPKHVLSLMIYFFQFCNISDFRSGLIVSVSWLCASLISPFIGIISDYIYKLNKDINRQNIGMVTHMFRVILMFTLFYCIPKEAESFIYFITISIFMGILSGWVNIGTHKPILIDIVKQKHTAFVMALMNAVENIGSSIIGTFFLSYLLNRYNYIDKKKVNTLTDAMRKHNVSVLSDVLLILTCVPWILSFCLLYILKYTYKVDKQYHAMN